MTECGAVHPTRKGVTCQRDQRLGPHPEHEWRLYSERTGTLADDAYWNNDEYVQPQVRGNFTKRQIIEQENQQLAVLAQRINGSVGPPRSRLDDLWTAQLGERRVIPHTARRLLEVYQRLIQARGEWVNGEDLSTPECGGAQGLKRGRELRAEYGIDVQCRPNPSSQTAWQYRIPFDPETSDEGHPVHP